jgi:hypothetical protein
MIESYISETKELKKHKGSKKRGVTSVLQANTLVSTALLSTRSEYGAGG